MHFSTLKKYFSGCGTTMLQKNRNNVSNIREGSYPRVHPTRLFSSEVEKPKPPLHLLVYRRGWSLRFSWWPDTAGEACNRVRLGYCKLANDRSIAHYDPGWT